MAISSSQLETWSHQGSITNSAATANAIKDAINSYKYFPTNISFDVYLSGSYKNDTNIYGDSDVDVVVELTSSFFNNLTTQQKRDFNFVTAEYGYFDFKADVLKCLRDCFTSKLIEEGKKAVKVYPLYTNRLNADVLICSSYRLYVSFANVNSFHQGIAFRRSDNNVQVINFPKYHSTNDTLKHQRTSSYFKPTIRIIKNMRSTLIDHDIIDKKLAPSYFIECLLYNVPDSNFTTNYSTSIYNVLDYLNNTDWENFKCVNGITPLWGITTETWDQISARKFLAAVINKWNNP